MHRPVAIVFINGLTVFLAVTVFYAPISLAGQVSLQNINRMMLTAEIGYTIAPSARSKGVATAAVRLLTKNAFAMTPLRKLIAYVHNENLPSKRVLEKVGYKQEGLLREHYLINGKPADEALFGILRTDF